MIFEKLSRYKASIDYVEEYLFPIFPDINGNIDYKGDCIARLKPEFFHNNVKLEKIKIVNCKLPKEYSCIVAKDWVTKIRKFDIVC
jgi:hypothetical protein